MHKEEFVEKTTKHLSVTQSAETMLLRAQLLAEYYVNSLLAFALPIGEGYIFSGDKTRFSDKLKKLQNIKLLRENQIEAIIRLNRLRNKFGHEIDYKVTESDLDYLGFCFGKKYFQDKYNLGEDPKVEPFKERLFVLLLDVCVAPAIKLSLLLDEDSEKK